MQAAVEGKAEGHAAVEEAGYCCFAFDVPRLVVAKTTSPMVSDRLNMVVITTQRVSRCRSRDFFLVLSIVGASSIGSGGGATILRGKGYMFAESELSLVQGSRLAVSFPAFVRAEDARGSLGRFCWPNSRRQAVAHHVASASASTPHISISESVIESPRLSVISSRDSLKMTSDCGS